MRASLGLPLVMLLMTVAQSSVFSAEKLPSPEELVAGVFRSSETSAPFSFFDPSGGLKPLTSPRLSAAPPPEEASQYLTSSELAAMPKDTRVLLDEYFACVRKEPDPSLIQISDASVIRDPLLNKLGFRHSLHDMALSQSLELRCGFGLANQARIQFCYDPSTKRVDDTQYCTQRTAWLLRHMHQAMTTYTTRRDKAQALHRIIDRRSQVRSHKAQLEESPKKGWIAAATLYGVFLLCLIVLLFGGVWKTKVLLDHPFVFALMGVTIGAAALRLAFWALISQGYVQVGQIELRNGITLQHVDLVDRFGQIAFAAVLSTFAFTLIKAALETFAPDRPWLVIATALVMGVLLLVVAVYAVAMAVISTTATSSFVLDVSMPLLAVFAVVLAGMVVVTFVAVIRLIGRAAGAEEQKELRTTELRHHAQWFLVASLGLSLLFCLRLVMVALWFGVDSRRYLLPLQVVSVVCNLTTIAAVCLYVGLAIKSAWRSPKKDGDGYVRLEEEIPAVYKM